ncbi:MAG: FAD-dependent oxidoreductase [Clostridiaceae bacterium]|nr:FAD-dependent oxidoreductase [Clostridiaceae bacterium]
MADEKYNKINILSVNPQSYWLDSTEQTNYLSLKEDIHVDVAIIGGGMTGVTTGYLLKNEGLKVAILEADKILQGTTGHTTAKITSQHGLIYDKLRTQMGVEKAQQYAEANESAVQMIASLIKEKNISCDFHWRPAYVYTQSQNYVKQIINETRAAYELGIKAEYKEEVPLPFKVDAAVRFNDQAQFHPRKYLLHLAKEIPGDGSYIFEGTKAVDIHDKNPTAVITGDGKKVVAKNIIIASHFPFYDLPGLYFARIYNERSYILGVKIQESFPEGMFINAENPTRSLRSQKFEGGELILVGGEHHKTGHGNNTSVHYENLNNFASDVFQVQDVLYRWSTQDCMTMDGIPYIGRLTASTPNIYVATGFCKWGMTNSTVSAMMLKDFILKGESPWADVYNPSRFNATASAVNFIVQNADVALNFVSGKLLPSSLERDVKPGEGKVIEIDGQKIGAYRDKKNNLHLVDITCTHMGCELKWNDAETSWDCPCHGSRFSCDGDIIEGPALKPLKKFYNY